MQSIEQKTDFFPASKHLQFEHFKHKEPSLRQFLIDACIVVRYASLVDQLVDRHTLVVSQRQVVAPAHQLYKVIFGSLV